MRKEIAVVLVIGIVIVGAISAYFLFTPPKTETRKITAATLLGGISTLDVIEDQNLLNKYGVELNVLRLQKTPDIIAALANGETDVAVIPAEMAAKLIQTGTNIVIFSVEMMQNQAILTLDSNIKNVTDLLGKKVGAVMASGTYKLFKAYMKVLYNISINEQDTVEPDKINVVNVVPGAIVDSLVNHDVDAVVIWEPFVSQLVVEYNATIVADFETMWSEYNNTLAPVMLVWVARKDIVGSEELNAFIKAQQEAAETWINATDIVIPILEQLYGLKNDTAYYLYNRVKVNTQALNDHLIESIKAEWNLAYLGGYLEQDPSTIPSTVFYS